MYHIETCETATSSDLPVLMQRFAYTLLVLLSLPLMCGTGWNDFEQPIGDGFSIFRANASDITLCYQDSPLFGSPGDPLIQFAVTPSHIFAEHEHATKGKSFFVVEKDGRRVIGPLSADRFAHHPVVVKLDAIPWQIPTNPHPERAVAGQRMFYVVTLAMLFAVFCVPAALIAFVVAILAKLQPPILQSDSSPAASKSDQ